MLEKQSEDAVKTRTVALTPKALTIEPVTR